MLRALNFDPSLYGHCIFKLKKKEKRKQGIFFPKVSIWIKFYVTNRRFTEKIPRRLKNNTKLTVKKRKKLRIEV